MTASIREIDVPFNTKKIIALIRNEAVSGLMIAKGFLTMSIITLIAGAAADLPPLLSIATMSGVASLFFIGITSRIIKTHPDFASGADIIYVSSLLGAKYTISKNANKTVFTFPKYTLPYLYGDLSLIKNHPDMHPDKNDTLPIPDLEAQPLLSNDDIGEKPLAGPAIIIQKNNDPRKEEATKPEQNSSENRNLYRIS